MRAKKSNTSEMTETIVLTPSDVTNMLAGLYLADAYDRASFFRGAPGIGKTSAVRAAVDKLRETYPDFGYIEINPTMPADEVGGIPDLIRADGQPTKTDYAMPSWFPTDPEWRGIICLDDMAQGDKMMQTTLANLIQAKNLRMHPLPKGAMIVGTGNRAEDNAGSGRLLTHLADRLTIFDIEPCSKSWINDFALSNGVDERIISYIQQHEDKLNMFNAKATKCPTSRTWAALATRMDYIDSLNTPDTKATYEKFGMAIMVGELGMGEAMAFWNFCQMWGQIPDINAILANPKDAALVESVDLQYATAAAIAKQMTLETFSNGLEYVERLNQDLTAMTVKLSTRNKPELADSEPFMDWASANQELIHGWTAKR